MRRVAQATAGVRRPTTPGRAHGRAGARQWAPGSFSADLADADRGSARANSDEAMPSRARGEYCADSDRFGAPTPCSNVVTPWSGSLDSDGAARRDLGSV